MSDAIINAIKSGRINSDNISFTKIRHFGGRDTPGVWSELGRGRNILSTYDQLDQYLYSYGPMTHGQWQSMLERMNFMPKPIQVVDYGCGQGLATVLLFDRYREKLIDNVSRVVLIEPSALALKRAEAIISCYKENINIVPINKKLDAVGVEEIANDSCPSTIHIFSNVLDINTFKHISLSKKIFSVKGQHSLLAVSHDRQFNGGSERLLEMRDAVNDPVYQEQVIVNKSIVNRSIYKDKNVISLFLNVEVKNGSI